MLYGINTVVLCFKQFIRRAVSENLSRQTIDANGKETYLISRILGDTLSLENESAKHPIVILICPLSLRGMRMGEMHFQLAIFQQRKFRKFRAIASDNCLEYFVLLAFEVFKNLFQKVEWL